MPLSIALAKTPLILARAGVLFQSLTPPALASEEERHAPTGLEQLFSRMISWPPFLAKLMFVFEALAETSSILAASFPSTLSSLVLEKLTGSSSTPVWTFTPSVIWTAGTLLAIGGGAFRLWSYRALGKHFTFQLAVLKDHSLITTGPYAIVRHPGYTGLIAMCIGNSLAIGADGSWSREVLFPDLFLEPWGFNARMLTWKRLFVIVNLAGQTVLAAALVARTKKEDKMLKDEFGGQWDKWAEKTPWALIPGVY